MFRPAVLAHLLVLVPAVLVAGCGPQRVVLPTGPGTPSTNFAEPLKEALSRCGDAQMLEGELGLSGRVGRQRMRGRVLAGFVPGALRLEGVPPIGSPIFILVADNGKGTLLLPRDERVLSGAPPEDILNALIGVRLGPDDLRALLLGCGKANVVASGGRAYGEDWIAVDLESGGTLFLQQVDSAWRIAGGRFSELEVGYGRFTGAIPGQIHLGGSGIDLTIALNQVDRNTKLARDELVALKIPPEATPISLEELRDAGPLGER